MGASGAGGGNQNGGGSTGSGGYQPWGGQGGQTNAMFGPNQGPGFYNGQPTSGGGGQQGAFGGTDLTATAPGWSPTRGAQTGGGYNPYQQTWTGQGGGGNYPGSQGGWGGQDQQPGGYNGGQQQYGFRGGSYGPMGPGGLDQNGQQQNPNSGNYDWSRQNPGSGSYGPPQGGGGWGGGGYPGGGGGWGGHGGHGGHGGGGGSQPPVLPPAPPPDLNKNYDDAQNAFRASANTANPDGTYGDPKLLAAFNQAKAARDAGAGGGAPAAAHDNDTADAYFQRLGHGAQTGADYDPLVQEASKLYGGMANTPGGSHVSNTGLRYALMHGATPQQAAQTAWGYAQSHGGDYNNNVAGHNQGEESGYGWGENPNDQIGLNYGKPNGGVTEMKKVDTTGGGGSQPAPKKQYS